MGNTLLLEDLCGVNALSGDHVE